MTVNWAMVNKNTGTVVWVEHDSTLPWSDEFHLTQLRRVLLSGECTAEKVAQLGTIRMVTTEIRPPVPEGGMDWGVSVYGQEEAGYQSFGATEGEAISDFILNYGN